MKYFIAASVLGACVGNMFVARRMRGIMKLKVPAAESTTAKGWAPHTNKSGAAGSTGGAGSGNAARARMEEEAARARQAQRVREYNFQQEQQEQVHRAYQTWQRSKFDPKQRPRLGGDHLDSLAPFLQTLALSSTQLPSKKEVKEAFAKIALSSHPDMVPPESPDRPRLQRRFAEANEAYKFILKKLETLETKE